MNLNKAFALFSTLALAVSVSATAQSAEFHNFKFKRSTVIEGYVSHGVNIYNGQRIADYSNYSPMVPWLNPTPLIDEVRAYDEANNTASVITESTDPSSLIATSDTFFNFMNPGGVIDPKVIDAPIGTIGSNYFGYTAATDRIVPEQYPMAGSEPSVYLAKSVNSTPTVEQWNEISGLITVREKPNGYHKVRITIKDGIPNGLYTLWDVGAVNPLTENEQGYAVPMGGLPNVMITNEKGCAYKEIEMPYSIVRECKEGAESCSSYINAVYHWDQQVYGASPGQTFLGLPAGVLAANQLTWPTSGDLLIDAPTDAPKHHGCFR